MMLTGLLQRKCACGGSSGPCKCADKRKMHRRANSERTPGTVPPIVNHVLASSGRALDAATRKQFEPRFGFDFGAVRIHDDSRADESARAVSAHAYTIGRDIVFASGQYQPHSARGARLLAHELTHVMQQRSSAIGFSAARVITEPGDADEVEADRFAEQALDGSTVPGKVRPSAGVLSRQHKPKDFTAAPGSGKKGCKPRVGLFKYGCYCGAKSSCEPGLDCEPADDLDALCQIHDREYGGCTFGQRGYRECCEITKKADQHLCDGARSLLSKADGEKRTFLNLVILTFCKHPKCVEKKFVGGSIEEIESGGGYAWPDELESGGSPR
jgi:hypothetical protein